MTPFLDWYRRLFRMSASAGPADAPIFIFAASWRTGSTLLQRIVNASGETFIWGEPTFLPEARKLFERTQMYLEKVKGNRQVAFRNAVGGWIPVVSPDPDRAAGAARAFFDALYLQETRALGVGRWGFKEVRGEAVANILFLSSLWPKARFMFLVRDPYDTYRSVKGKKFHANFKEPMQPIQIWNANVTEFLDVPEMGARCLLIKYEELAAQSRANNGLLRAIADHLHVPLSERMFLELEARADPSGQDIELTDHERTEIARIAGVAAQRIGYTLR